MHIKLEVSRCNSLEPLCKLCQKAKQKTNHLLLLSWVTSVTSELNEYLKDCAPEVFFYILGWIHSVVLEQGFLDSYFPLHLPHINVPKKLFLGIRKPLELQRMHQVGGWNKILQILNSQTFQMDGFCQLIVNVDWIHWNSTYSSCSWKYFSQT